MNQICFLDIPKDVLCIIALELYGKQLISFACVCHQTRSIVQIIKNNFFIKEKEIDEKIKLVLDSTSFYAPQNDELLQELAINLINNFSKQSSDLILDVCNNPYAILFFSREGIVNARVQLTELEHNRVYFMGLLFIINMLGKMNSYERVNKIAMFAKGVIERFMRLKQKQREQHEAILFCKVQHLFQKL